MVLIKNNIIEKHLDWKEPQIEILTNKNYSDSIITIENDEVCVQVYADYDGWFSRSIKVDLLLELLLEYKEVMNNKK